MTLPYDPETSQNSYMSLDSPLPYLEFPESLPTYPFRALRISEIRHRLDKSTNRSYSYGSDEEDSVPENVANTASNREDSFELETLSNSTERSDISDWGSSFDAEENAFENHPARLSVAIPHTCDHTLCKETVEVQRVTIEMLVESLRVANFEISTHGKWTGKRSKEDAKLSAVVLLQRRIERELNDLLYEFLKLLPSQVKSMVTKELGSFRVICQVYSNPNSCCLRDDFDLGNLHMIARDRYHHFEITTNNRGSILHELLNYLETSQWNKRPSYQTEEDARIIQTDGIGHTLAVHRLIREAFDSEMGRKWKDEDKEKVLNRLAYPGIPK